MGGKMDKMVMVQIGTLEKAIHKNSLHEKDVSMHNNFEQMSQT
jgi:hypothetical protein